MLAKVEAVGDGGEVRLGQLSTLERLDERIYRLKIAIPWPSCKIQGGSIMRIIFAFAILASSLALGGCFHHNHAAYAEPLPPMAHPPLK
jgi:hypothetical protein